MQNILLRCRPIFFIAAAATLRCAIFFMANSGQLTTITVFTGYCLWVEQETSREEEKKEKCVFLLNFQG